MPTKTFSALINEARRRDEHWEEWAISDFTEELSRRIDELGISRTVLAERLGASQPYVTKVLRGDANFTIRSMTKLARAVDRIVRIHLAPAGSVTVWKDDIAGGAYSAAHNKDATIPFGEPSSIAASARATAIGAGSR